MKKIFNLSIIILILISLCIVLINEFNILFPTKYIDTINENCKMYNLDNKLVLSIINVESNFNAKSISKANAIGLMQIQLETAKDMANIYNEDYSNINLFNSEDNIKFGCRYLRYLIDYYNGNYTNALCAYNAGLGNVNNWLRTTSYTDESGKLIKIPFKETENYIKKIKNNYKIYKIYEKIGKINN